MKANVKNKSKLLPFLVVCGVGMIFILYYSTLTSPLEKILVLMITSTCCIPFIFGMFTRLITTFTNNLKEQDKANPYSRKVDKNGNLILKKDLYKKNNYSSNTVEKQFAKKEEPKRKPKVVTTEGYQELKNVIIATSKNKLLDRETILEFKAELRNKLGVHYECYKNMIFKNDLHEIYTIIKSSKFNTKDYNEMTEWISQHIKTS